MAATNSGAPCLNCPDRHIGCHAKCEKYLSWEKEHQEYLALKRQLEEVDIYNAIKARASNSSFAKFRKSINGISSIIRGSRK